MVVSLAGRGRWAAGAGLQCPLRDGERLDRWGPRRAPPFAAAVFRWRAVGGAAGIRKPIELSHAEFVDHVLTRWPGYTIESLMREDAYVLMQMLDLLSPDLGKAEDDG